MRSSRFLTALLALTLSACGPSPKKMGEELGSEDGRQTEVQPTPTCNLDSICGDDECKNNQSCPGFGVCAGDVGERICIQSGSVSDNVDYIQNGVHIREAPLDERGRAAFPERNKDELAVIIGTNVETRRPARAAIVTYVDGDNFEGFFFGEDRRYSQYLPSINIFPHNSAHQIRLVPKGFEAQYRDLTIVDYVAHSDPQTDPLINYLDWAQKGGYVYEGCKTREQLQQDREYSMMILSLLKGGPVFKFIVRALENVSALEELGVFTSESSPAYHIYAPVRFTAPQYFEGFTPTEEIEHNRLDDDCDGEVDERVVVCTPNTYKRCVLMEPRSQSREVWFTSCDEPQMDQIVRYCNDGCSEDGVCYTSRADRCGPAHRECDRNAVVLVDSCGQQSGIVHGCSPPSYCQNGECVARTDNPPPTPDPIESPEPSSRFVVRDNGQTVYDNVHHRYWTRSSASVGMTLSAAQGYCDSLTLAGRDWRLPFYAELDQIKVEQSDGCQLPDEFSHRYCGFTWTDTPCDGRSWYNLIVDFAGSGGGISLCRNPDEERVVFCSTR